MITGKQIRAARILLDWDAIDLAQRSGVNRETIFHIERGDVQARPATLKKIVEALDAFGIELIGNRGVAKRDDDLRIIEGEGCYEKFLEFIFSVMQGTKKTICFYCTDDRLSTTRVNELCRLMHEDGLQTHFICEEGNLDTVFSHDKYRWIPKKFFNNDVQTIFGDYVGTLINRGQAVYIIHNSSYAQTQRKIFDFVWENCGQLG